MKNTRTMEIYNQYVCPKCFHKLPECTCGESIPETLLHIDEGLQEHIRILCNKGYYTTVCCEGHWNEEHGIYTYIGCKADIDKAVDIFPLPDGFKLDRRNKIINCKIKSDLGKEKAEELKAKRLNDLLEWIESLPAYGEVLSMSWSINHD